VKKQYHLPLTKGAKSELKKLSDFKNKTENEILEELIHQMYLKEMCDEDGKLKY
jgi:predicted DNA-binding protein